MEGSTTLFLAWRWTADLLLCTRPLFIQLKWLSVFNFTTKTQRPFIDVPSCVSRIFPSLKFPEEQKTMRVSWQTWAALGRCCQTWELLTGKMSGFWGHPAPCDAQWTLLQDSPQDLSWLVQRQWCPKSPYSCNHSKHLMWHHLQFFLSI